MGRQPKFAAVGGAACDELPGSANRVGPDKGKLAKGNGAAGNLESEGSRE
jgi:hypothetical protein